MNSNPVAAVNILLSTNRENLEKFISSGEIPEPGDGSYLFSSKNTNFLSLEATFSEIILKIQDPNEKFITNLIPANIQEVMDAAMLQKTDASEFFLMYGLGADPDRHWAGPLRVSLKQFNHYTEAAGTDAVEMTFSPGMLDYESQLKQQNIDTPLKFLKSMGGSFANKATTLQVAPTIESNPLYTRSQSGSNIAVKIGFTFVNTGMWGGEYPPWTISPEDMTKALRKLYTNYFTQWGSPNSIILISKEFEEVLKKFNRPTISYNANVQTSKSVLAMQTFLSQFGLDLIIQATGKSNSYSEKIDLLLDINPVYKFSNNFKAPMSKFYDALGALSNTKDWR